MNIASTFKRKWTTLRSVTYDLRNDVGTRLGRWRYPHPILYIAGLPKSGTTWLCNLLSCIPGYNIGGNSYFRHLSDPDGCLLEHKLCRDVIAGIPRDRYTVVKFHTYYCEKTHEILAEYDLPTVVLIRDLRDMMISRYHHILKDSQNRYHKQYNEVSFEEGLLLSFDHALPEYRDWVKGWIEHLDTLRVPGMLVKYEEMRADVERVLKEVLAFYGFEASDALVKQILARHDRFYARSRSLEANLAAPGRTHSTFRKGQIGEWRECYTDAHRQRFKELAGDVLIAAGYETDNDW